MKASVVRGLFIALTCLLASFAHARPSEPEFKVKTAGTLLVNGTIRIPAYVISVADATGDAGDFATPPLTAADMRVQGSVSADTAGALAAYQTNVGWLLVPRGWRVTRAAVGVDNSSVYAFKAPSGAGQIVSQDSGGACVGCAFSLASPFFPEARKQARAMDLGDNDSGTRVRGVRLGKHTMGYQQKGTGGQVLDGIAWYNGSGDFSAFTYEVTLPPSQHALATAILNWRLPRKGDR